MEVSVPFNTREMLENADLDFLEPATILTVANSGSHHPCDGSSRSGLAQGYHRCMEQNMHTTN